MRGRRRPDGTRPWELEPGDYCFREDERTYVVVTKERGEMEIEAAGVYVDADTGVLYLRPPGGTYDGAGAGFARGEWVIYAAKAEEEPGAA